MNEVKMNVEGKIITVFLSGRIDSANAPTAEKEITDFRSKNPANTIVVDCDKLEYISSAGLRIILRLKKETPDTTLINVSPDVYEIFDMTGFTEIMDIKKAYRVISVDGCEVIGQGANGKVYRIDKDTIVKVYLNPDALPEIHRERELARTAFVLGIPTAIPYDVVRISDGGYGSVFELLNAKSFAKLLSSGEKSLDEIAEMSVKLLKTIHSTVVKPESMPDMKEIGVNWVKFLKDYLPEDSYAKLYSFVTAIPEDNHMLHGDYHVKNVMLQNGECLLIDMDTLCYGHPVFEFASVYNAYVGYSDLDHAMTESFLGLKREVTVELWNKILELYFKDEGQEKIADVANKAMVIGYVRNMRRTIRRKGFETEQGRAVIENCKNKIEEILPKIDSLTF
ncbi:MAG: anti-sigma factor antagonist [Clostridia bacterium]|nr:anti-sigma factor antagonist [Clostridia bacterium]